MYLNSIWLLLLSSILIGIFGRFFGRDGCIIIGIFSIFFSFLISLFIFFEVVLNQCIVSIKLYNWIGIDIYNIEIGFLFDSLSCIMLLIVTFISFIVHMYSATYMKSDPYISRFICYLSLFTFFMLFLITSDNFLQLFFGWEGVGLSSYLLINFWFTRISANKAALKAMIMNRIADVFFILAVVLIFLFLKPLIL